MATDQFEKWCTDRAWCPDCGKEHKILRPGKTQPVCDCHETCPVHGRNKIVYHSEDEAPKGQRISGYYCMECMEDGD